MSLVLSKLVRPSIFSNGDTVVWEEYSYTIYLIVTVYILTLRQSDNFALKPDCLLNAFIFDV